MTISANERLTGDHCLIHPCVRVAEVRAQSDATIPDGYEPLGIDAYARRLGVHRSTAHRHMERLTALQGDPETLRVIRLPVRIGKGGHRRALHVLWPRPQTQPAESDTSLGPPQQRRAVGSSLGS